MPIDIRESLSDHAKVIESLSSLIPDIELIAQKMTESLRNGGRIYWAGNGGSAADCQHLAAELVGRFERERKALASVAFTTDTSVLTSIGNDYGFESIYSRQVDALCTPSDIFVGITTSGNSPNILRAIDACKKTGTYAIGFTGHDGGRMALLADHTLIVPAKNTARIQEAHILIGHILCDWIEASFAGPGNP